MKRDGFDERLFSPLRETLSGSGELGQQPPSIPMDSSERGAEVAAKHAPSQNDRILLALRAAGCVPLSGKYLSRDAIAERCELTVNAACGRLGPSGKLVVGAAIYTPSCAMPIIAAEDVCLSSAGVWVLGYQLTSFGVGVADRLARRSAA